MRWALAWVLWAIGDVIARIDRALPFGTLYPIYNSVMLASERAQGPSAHGPWGEDEVSNAVRVARKAVGDE